MADRRIQRTRKALVDAYGALVLRGHRGRIRVADVLDESKVARSTFYAHYDGADALHLDSLRRPLALLADAAAGKGDEQKLAMLLQHFWDFRQRARDSFGPAAERLLAQMVAERLADRALTLPPELAARQLAAAALAPLGAWLRAEAWCPPGELASSICRTGRAQVDALVRNQA